MFQPPCTCSTMGFRMLCLAPGLFISPSSVEDTMSLLECLGQIRSLLIVQMGLPRRRTS